jgi:O-antigen/teichoic acid export membrane protein
MLGISAQFTQAVTSLLLGMVAVRVLTPADFGRFSIVIATLLVLTGLMTGLVGDSLTVLDRHDQRVRSAIQVLGLASACVGGVATIAFGLTLGWFDPSAAPIVAVAVFVFLLEDALRRLLMASGSFVRVLAVDAAYAVAAAIVLGALSAAGGIEFAGIFLAMALGQSFAIVVAIILLPKSERRFSRSLTGDFATVVSFGGWRAVQGVLGPARLWAARLMVAASAGMAAAGLLEANRLLISPVLLAVQGTASAILVHYSRVGVEQPAQCLRRADRDATALTLGALAAVLFMVLAAPLLGQVLLGSTALVDRVVMLGWGLTAVGMGASLPYATLTAVFGAPRSTAAIRMLDLVLSIVGVSLLLSVADPEHDYKWVPAVLGLVVIMTSVVQRWVCRRRVDAIQTAAPRSAGATPVTS